MTDSDTNHRSKLAYYDPKFSDEKDTVLVLPGRDTKLLLGSENNLKQELSQNELDVKDTKFSHETLARLIHAPSHSLLSHVCVICVLSVYLCVSDAIIS